MFAARKTDNVSSAANYIEDVFSTYLYTGNGSTQTITNNIDLSTKGGLVWIKSRNDTYDHFLYDTARGATKSLQSDTTSAEQTYSDSLTAFNSNGFALGANVRMNANTTTYVSWTFRKQAKFFDVVTYTGNGIAGRTVAHTLGSVPGCMIVKQTNGAGGWSVYHRSIPITQILELQTTGSAYTYDQWNSTQPTSTNFTVSADSQVNGNGNTYVAYLFAHDAGGFGLSGTDNVITCGSFSSTGSGGPSEINLGYEPQWVMLKTINSDGSWTILDNMRGWVSGTTGDSSRLFANLANAESVTSVNFRITSTGFTNVSGTTNYIYIAIRRGPMKIPTSGTTVFTPATRTGTGATATLTAAGFPVDSMLIKQRDGTNIHNRYDRLRGTGLFLDSASTAAETSYGGTTGVNNFASMTGVSIGSNDSTNLSGGTFIDYYFRRAPGFFDVVCYTGTGSNTTFTHNLGVVPEMMLVKRRSATNAWAVYANNDNTDYLVLNTNAATVDDNTYWNDTSPTSSVFSVGTNNAVNASGSTYVAYLFASVTGVSKVGSYTGNGSNQTINCGFTAGARFILIKRYDSTGDWYVYDTARGIVSGNDPQLKLNDTAAEATGYDAIDPDNSGFIVNNDATNFPINVNNATYIYLAIA